MPINMSMTISATEQDELYFLRELDDFIIQGWCACEGCGETFEDWQSFRTHAYPCVFSITVEEADAE